MGVLSTSKMHKVNLKIKLSRYIYKPKFHLWSIGGGTSNAKISKQPLPIDLLKPLPDDNSVSSDELENLSEQTLQRRGLKVKRKFQKQNVPILAPKATLFLIDFYE